MRKRALLTLVTLCATRQVFGLDPHTRITQYFHTSWRAQDGAFEAAPNAVAQTADGYIWIGTGSGLVKYDGVRFVPWAPPPGKSLTNPNVISLLGASDGTLWIGTAGGLLSWKNNNLQEHLKYRIDGIIEDHKHEIWVAQARSSDHGGLCQVTGERPVCLGADNRMNLPSAGVLAEDGHGNLWVSGPSQFLRWRDGSFQSYREQLGLGAAAYQVEGTAAAADGSVWVSVSSDKSPGLLQIVDGRLKRVVLDGVKKQEFTTLFADREGSLWLATANDGFYRFFHGQVDHFWSENGLSSNTVSGFFEDREGNLWVTTSKGLDFFRENRVVTFSTSEGLSADLAGPVLAGNDGTVWIGNRGALDVIRDGKVTSIRIPGQRVTALWQDHASRMWIGINKSLAIYEEGKFRNVNRPDGSPLGMITAIGEDREQNIWAAANPDRKLYRIRDLRVQEEFSPPRISNPRLVTEDPTGGVWLGFTGALGHYRDGKLDMLGQSAAVSLTAEADGSLWVPTRAGLVRRKDGRTETLTSKNGLKCNAIYAAIRDDRRTLWLYTQCGLVGVADSELERWWRDPGSVIQSRVFDALDGATPYSSTFQPGASKSPDGRLWFVNDSVVQMFDPAKSSQERPAPPVYVEGVRVDRRDFGIAGPVHFPPNPGDIEISYTALSYSIPQRVRFRYKLEPRDRDWQDAGTRRQAFYSDLPPGQYRFHVTASNSDGVWNETGGALEFSILPAYYQTNWFRALLAATVLALMWAAYQFRVRLLQRESRQLRDVIDTIPASAWSAGPDGSVEFINERWLEFNGFSTEKGLGWGWETAIHPEDRDHFLAEWRGAIESGKPMEAEARVLRSDGQYRWLLIRNVPLQNKKGKVVKWYGTSTDIEDLKRAEKEREKLRQLEADLAHINRVDMMGELAASVAHEVNQPLTGIVSNGGACLRWLAGDAPNLEEARDAVRDIVRDGKRAGEVIARIRALTKRASPPKEKLDLNEVVREALAIVNDQAKKNSVTIRTQFAADVWPILGDRVQLQQVLLNLMMNAMEAMSSVGERSRQLSIITRNINMDQVQVTVEDTGLGLDPNAMPRIFEAFYTTKSGGMGMGLSISRSILQNHGGRVWATGNKGPGTSFHFTLPKYHGAEESAGDAAV